jgi:hypothetical protein
VDFAGSSAPAAHDLRRSLLFARCVLAHACGTVQIVLRWRMYALQVAFVGFAVQALVSRTQPIEGLTKHLGNPGYNITYTLTHL